MASLCEDRSHTHVSWTEDEQLRHVSISCLCLLLWPSAVHVRGNFSFMPIQNDLRDEQTGFLHLCFGAGRLLSGQGAGRGGWKQNQGFPCERGSHVLLANERERVTSGKVEPGGENQPSKGHPLADWAPPGPFHCLGAELTCSVVFFAATGSPDCNRIRTARLDPPKRATSLHC